MNKIHVKTPEEREEEDLAYMKKVGGDLTASDPSSRKHIVDAGLSVKS